MLPLYRFAERLGAPEPRTNQWTLVPGPVEAKPEGTVGPESLRAGDIRYGTGDGDDAGPHG